ncbi:MAG: hypothetical protein Q4B12_03455 [Bowdeniella nasicola]|nr:hypothetical protein [Bowdeniella nasicola]
MPAKRDDNPLTSPAVPAEPVSGACAVPASAAGAGSTIEPVFDAEVIAARAVRLSQISFAVSAASILLVGAVGAMLASAAPTRAAAVQVNITVGISLLLAIAITGAALWLLRTKPSINTLTRYARILNLAARLGAAALVAAVTVGVIFTDVLLSVISAISALLPVVAAFFLAAQGNRFSDPRPLQS